MAMSVARPVSWLIAATSWIVYGIQDGRECDAAPDRGLNPQKTSPPEDDIRGTIDLHHSEAGLDAKNRHRLVGALDLKDMTVVRGDDPPQEHHHA